MATDSAAQMVLRSSAAVIASLADLCGRRRMRPMKIEFEMTNVLCLELSAESGVRNGLLVQRTPMPLKLSNSESRISQELARPTSKHAGIIDNLKRWGAR